MNREFVKIDSPSLPFPDKSFDSISCVEVVEHLDLRLTTSILAEFFRVLKPRGKLIVTTPNYGSFWPLIELMVNRLSRVSYEEQHITKFRCTSLEALLKANGFSSVGVSSFMGISPFLAGINWKFADEAWRFDQALSRLPGVGLLLLGLVFVNPDPKDGKIHRLRRLHRFKRLEGKNLRQSHAPKSW